jgi:hypothetical protein
MQTRCPPFEKDFFDDQAKEQAIFRIVGCLIVKVIELGQCSCAEKGFKECGV